MLIIKLAFSVECVCKIDSLIISVWSNSLNFLLNQHTQQKQSQNISKTKDYQFNRHNNNYC